MSPVYRNEQQFNDEQELSWYRAALECNYMQSSNNFNWDSGNASGSGRNLLVTFDYGYSDSVEEENLPDRIFYEIEEDSMRINDDNFPSCSLQRDEAIWFNAMWHKPVDIEAKDFQVHHIQHPVSVSSLSVDSLDSLCPDNDFENCLVEPVFEQDNDSENRNEDEDEDEEEFYDSIECV